MPVELTPLVDVIAQLLAAVLAVLIAWAVRRYGKKLGVEIDEENRARLQDALDHAINFGANALRKRIADEDGKITVEIENEILAKAANYAVEAVPDTLAHFGITHDKLIEMLSARLVIEAAPTPAGGGT